MSYVRSFRADPKDWKRIQDANSVHLKRFFCNVDILSVSRYGSRNKAINAIRAQGYSVSSMNVKRFKVGVFTDSRLSNLQKWCLLFDVDLVEMLSRDFSKEDV